MAWAIIRRHPGATVRSEHSLVRTPLTEIPGFSEEKVHAICKRASEEFHFANRSPFRLDLPICKPSKSSRQTLANSGTILGLAPHPGSLSRISSSPLLEQLHERGPVPGKLWSVTLLDGESGVLSLGGTIAREMEEAEIRGEVELKHFGDPIATSQWVSKQVDIRMQRSMPPLDAWDKHFRWTDVQGAAGWWTALMRGVWINGAKVHREQPKCR